MTISNNNKLEQIEKKMAQLKAQKQALLNREREKERKARTQRLIQNGALAEKYLQCENLTPEDFEKFLQHPAFKEVLNIVKSDIKKM